LENASLAVQFHGIANARGGDLPLLMAVICSVVHSRRTFPVTTDPIMADIMAAIAVLQGGDRADGKAKLEAIWSRIESDPQPIHECTLAHYLADAQNNLADELAWDLRALDAGLRCSDADAQQHSRALSIAAFMPSLHVNLAEDYFKLGDKDRSRQHIASAREAVSHLADDGYGRMIRGGIERLARRLGPTD
jgi:hypothetical protein